MSFRHLKLLQLAVAAGALAAGPLDGQTATTHVDEAKHEVSLIVGPFDVPAVDPAEDPHAARHGGMDHSTMKMDGPETGITLYRFEWPVDGYGKGFRVEMRDAQGRILPRSLVHHVIGVNIDRRQFVYPAMERLFGLGRETENVMLPGKLAVPLERGQRLGYYVMWHNETGKSLSGVSIRVIMNYVPANATRDMIAVLPVWIDVNNEVGVGNTYDIVKGKSAKPFEFVAPVDGRILAMGGHMHDYGVAMRLEDAETGATLVRVAAIKDAQGHLQSMSRKVFAFNGPFLKAGHRYRLIADYNNPLDHAIVNGAMGNVTALLAPEDARNWPAIDPADASFRKDVASLGMGEWTPVARRGAPGDSPNR